MLGVRSGFQTLMKEIALFVLFSHCIIHRYALGTLSSRFIGHIYSGSENRKLHLKQCDEYKFF